MLEYCPLGELYQQLTAFGRLPAKVVSKITHDVVQGLQFAHKKSVLHRDIKLENVLVAYSPELVQRLEDRLAKSPASEDKDLLDKNSPEFLLQCSFKLADFGWSVHHPGIAQKSILNVSRRKTQCGTLDYLPPQIILGQPYHYGCDIWSLGVMVYELLAGQPPFFHEMMENTKENIV